MRTLAIVALLLILGTLEAGGSIGRQCKRQCGLAVSACISTTGQRLRACKRQIRRQCRREGLQTCTSVTTTTTLPPPLCRPDQTDCGTFCCSSDFPICASDGSRTCCGSGFPIRCADRDGDGHGFCCRSDHPICGLNTSGREACFSPPGWVFISFHGGIKKTDPPDADTSLFTLLVGIDASDENPSSIPLMESFFEAADELNARYPAEPATGVVPECPFLGSLDVNRQCVECTGSLFLPPGGFQECVVRFRLPSTVTAGVLHFTNGTYSDSTSFNGTN